MEVEPSQRKAIPVVRGEVLERRTIQRRYSAGHARIARARLRQAEELAANRPRTTDRPRAEAGRSKAAFAAVGIVAGVGIGGMVTVITLNYAGWSDVADNLLRAFNVKVPELDRVPFWESLIYLGVLGLVVYLVIREILRALNRDP